MSYVEKSKITEAGGMILAVGSLMVVISFYPAITILHWIGFRIFGLGLYDNAFTMLGYFLGFGAVIGILGALWELFVETKVKMFLIILIIIYIITLPTAFDVAFAPIDGGIPDISLENLFWGWVWSYLSIWWVKYVVLFGAIGIKALRKK